MKVLFCAGLLTLLYCAFLPLGVSACDCGTLARPVSIREYSSGLCGRVIKIASVTLNASSGDRYQDLLIFFEVERNYRGPAGKTAEVVTGSGGADWENITWFMHFHTPSLASFTREFASALGLFRKRATI
jgi:hypothetical protein